MCIRDRRYSWKASAEPGSRILGVEVAEGDAWVPLDPAKVYGVVSNNYVRGGGDGYRMFVDAANAYDYGPGLEQVVADFIANMGGTYTPYLDGRITRVE
jgi:5'-nucleotidase